MDRLPSVKKGFWLRLGIGTIKLNGINLRMASVASRTAVGVVRRAPVIPRKALRSTLSSLVLLFLKSITVLQTRIPYRRIGRTTPTSIQYVSLGERPVFCHLAWGHCMGVLPFFS